jgi:hypothetical protein
MPSFFGRIKSGFENVRYTKTGGTVDYAEPVDTSSPVFIRDLRNGTAANEANYFFKQEVTIASGGTFVLDLAGTANEDIFGTPLAMTSVVSIIVINRAVDDAAAENTTNVTLTTTLAGLFGGTSPTAVTKPGGMLQMANANAGGLCAVTAGSADTITLTNAAGASAKVQICVIGRG